MTHPELQSHQRRFGSFMLAGAIYIAGVVLFSLWSYSIHRNALLAHADASLIDAAYSMQEILTEEYLAELSSTAARNETAFAGKQRSLSRMANRGKFSSYGVITINNGNIGTLIAGTGTSPALVENSIHTSSFSNRFQTYLWKRAEAVNNDAALYSDIHPKGHSLRYAILYKAQSEGQGMAFLVSQKSSVINQELAGQALRTSFAGLGMLALAIPLILIFSQYQRKAAAELSDMNDRLQHDVELQHTREEELKDAISELQRFNAVTAGRESRVIELKAEVNTLLEKLNREKRYNIERTD